MPSHKNSSDGHPARKCAYCGEAFTTRRSHARFCGSDCTKAWGRRNTARGGVVMPILQAWAATRHAKPGTREAEINRYARRELTAMAGAFNEKDPDHARAEVLKYVGDLMDSKSIYADRARS